MAHVGLAVLLLLGACLSSAVGVDLRADEQEERECYGTTVGFGYSGTLEFHYQQLRKRYAGCTYIHGNLEITNILDPSIQYDLNFLKTIRYVSGYVLLGLITEVEHIAMDSLEVIRANNTYRIMGKILVLFAHVQVEELGDFAPVWWALIESMFVSSARGDDYSLVVVLTSRLDEDNSGLKRLHMPRLKEISYGKVLFTRNPSLGYVNTINWEPIVRGRPDSVHFLDHAFDETVSENDDLTKCAQGGKWGDDSSLCQQALARTCHENCQGRCFGPGEQECCHNSCAVGCNGDSDELCFVCKDYQYENHCVGFCPAKSYPKLQNCVKY